MSNVIHVQFRAPARRVEEFLTSVYVLVTLGVWFVVHAVRFAWFLAFGER